MGLEEGSAEDTTWPIPKFRFEVDLGIEIKGVEFQEVTGMEAENQIIENSKSNSPLFSTENMPGITKYGNITMKRGIFINDNTFWNWYNEINMNTIKRQTIIIKLLEEAGGVIMQWTLNNAWLTKITSTNLKNDGNEIVINSIEIAHQGIELTNGK
ncbi:MAG: phage tail-like protein [Flavobacteriales bacterium]|jgi:phage tail-like protein